MSNPDPSSEPHDNDEVEDIDEFPYEELENEMREAVLKNIHNPQEKLNVLNALPPRLDTERLMHWNHTTIQFELIYPLIYQYLKWPYENDTRSWRNVFNLCKVSAEFQRIVLRHYEKYINTTHNPEETEFQDYRQEPIWRNDPLKNVLKVVSDPSSPSWLTTLPFAIATSFITGGGVKLLKQLGGKVWTLEISLIFAYNRIPGIINYLIKCLRLVPNLRRLGLADFCPNRNEDFPPVYLHNEGGVLLELPYLKMISLMGDCSNCQQWILPKYTRQLEVLDIQDCYLTENFNPTCFPKLETVHIKFTQQNPRMIGSVEGVNDLFNKLVLSPLKVITVFLDNANVPNFTNFMLTLNNFEKTLHTLEMKFGTMDAEMGDDEVRNGLPAWIIPLNFPKLSCLYLDCYVGPLEFLLKMPALRKLSIVTSSRAPLQRSNIEGLNFSIEREIMLESEMWKLFPVLESFQMDTKVYENARIEYGDPIFLRIPGICLTRKCYEKHQRNIEC